MKIALYFKQNKLSDEQIAEYENKIVSYGFKLDHDNPDVVLFIGGDGTFLRAVHRYIDIVDKVKFIGLNKGHLGYFIGYNEDEIDLLLANLKSNKCHKESYRLLKASFSNSEIYAVNEIRIESPFQTLISEVEINGQKLETFRGNGLVVSSSLGSSAYNKSLSGAIVSPKLEALELTEIAPINNRIYHSLHSSLVLDSSSTITLKPKTSNIIVGYDELIKDDENYEYIKFSLSDKKVSLLYKEGFNYIRHLAETFTED